MSLRYRVIQWLARITLGLVALTGLALFLAYVPTWAGVVTVILGGALVLILVHRLET